jgi:hypothetical protein
MGFDVGPRDLDHPESSFFRLAFEA